MTTVALVAAKDAAASVGATVVALSALRAIDEVWVVDDGSADDTAAQAEHAGARVVRLDTNVGKGEALAAGVAATPHAKTYLLADADLGATATGLAPLLAGGADLVIGVLPSAGGRGGFGMVKRFARAGIRRATGLDAAAPLSGQRLVDAERLRAVTLAPRFGVEVGMTIDVLRAGGTVEERPVDVDHRHSGRSWRGFLHRARQGRDIAGALLPRVTSTGQRIAAVVIAASIVLVGLTGLSRASAPARGVPLPRAERVLLFAFDHLSLDDLNRADLPALRSLRSSGVTGGLNVNTLEGGRGGPTTLGAYASLGASARVRSVPELANPVADGRGARLSGMARAREVSRHDRAANSPGALGDALHAAGKRTGVVAGAQPAGATVGQPAYAALADRHGLVDHAALVPSLIERAAGAPLGLRSSSEVFVVETVKAFRDADVVLVDPGDTGRAFAADNAALLRAGALRHTDELLGLLLQVRPPGTTVIVFSPTPPGGSAALVPVLVGGAPRKPGTIASSSTRRASLAVLADVAPTTLALLGVRAPAAMTGTAVHSVQRTFDLANMQRLNADGMVRTRFFVTAAVGYTAVGLAFYVAFIALLLVGADTRVRRALRLGTCIAAAFPLALLAQGALQHWTGRGGESPVVLLVLGAALGVAASRLRGLRPVYALAAMTVAVIAVDVAVTGPIQAASVVGYSLQTTGRFFGLANATFSIFASCLLLLAAAAAGRSPTRVRATAATTMLAAGVAFLAAPWLGNDIGGTLTMVPVTLACAWVFFDRPFTPRVVVAGGVLALLALGALTAAEATFGSGTHLGRAARSNSSLTNTLIHRADVNAGLLVHQPWGFLCIAVAGAGLVTLVLQRRWTDYLPPRSPLRVIAISVLVVSLFGFAVNDSGPVVIVLCLVVLAPAMALTALQGPVTEPAVAPVQK